MCLLLWHHRKHSPSGHRHQNRNESNQAHRSNCQFIRNTRKRNVLTAWDSPGKNAGVGSHALLQGIFTTQGLNPHLLHLLHCGWILYCWATGEALYLLLPSPKANRTHSEFLLRELFFSRTSFYTFHFYYKNIPPNSVLKHRLFIPIDLRVGFIELIRLHLAENNEVISKMWM